METHVPSFHLRSPARDASAASLSVVLSGYSSEIDALLSQADLPPVDKSERYTWADGVEEECKKLMNNLFRLRTDAQQAAELHVPGTKEICTKVDAALMSCARCYRMANEALQTWSVEQSFRLVSKLDVETLNKVAMVLDKSAYSSISKAVEDLNAGRLSCPEGCCIVQSASDGCYVLFRSDKRERALDLFDAEVEPSVTWSEAAGREYGADRYRFGDVLRTSVRATKTNMLDWATREKTRRGYEFGDLFLKRLASTMFGGSAHISLADKELTISRLEDLSSFEDSILSVMKFDSGASMPEIDM